MEDGSGEGPRRQEGAHLEEAECHAWLNQLTDGITDLPTLRALADLLEALYQARGWPLPGFRSLLPSLFGLVLALSLIA